MNFLREPKGKYIYLVILAVILLVLKVDVGISPRVCLFAEDNQSIYPDKAGREALRLWTERERDRSRAEAARRYRDYWLYHPFPSYLYPPSAYWMLPYYWESPPWFSYPYPYEHHLKPHRGKQKKKKWQEH